MKKLVLKKDIVARINVDQMNHLKGGAADYHETMVTCDTCICLPILATCGVGKTCDPTCAPTCYATCVTCPPTCNNATCNNCY